MHKIIEQLLEGQFDSGGGSLDFSCPRLELSLHKDETGEGTFTIYGPKDRLTEGTVSSSELRMHCLTESFSGPEEEIAYRFDAGGLEEGDVLKGEFRIISNQGEYFLPFVVSIEHAAMESSLGNVRNLFHFANLAKTNWQEAVKLFYSPQFSCIFSGNDRQYESAYRGLSAVPGNEQNMEEFLLEINKKQKIAYLPDKKEIRLKNPEGNAEYTILVSRNGWGCTFLELETEGDFLSVEKETVTDDDFLGNSFYLHYFIDSGRLHAGNNYGRILVRGACTSIRIPIVVTKSTETKAAAEKRREKRRIVLELMQDYQSFRTRKLSSAQWLERTGKLVDRLCVLDSQDVEAALYKAQLLITEKRYSEAKWLLERIHEALGDEEECDPALWCYYLYLTTLYSGEESYIDKAAARVEGIYSRCPDSWRIAWLLLYMSAEYGRSPSRKWVLLSEQFGRGCTSPVIYIEAWHLLAMNPSLLAKLDRFELQVLNYAAKRGLLTPELIMQVEYLAKKQKQYSERLFVLLKACYERMPGDEALEAVCSLLIKGGKAGASYFDWYAKGVERELRITRLYEHYMMSLPPGYDGELPRMVLLYFAYQSDLDEEKNAFLYAYVHRRREELPEIYENYSGRIERFVLDQLNRGRIDRNVAYLYKQLLTEQMMNPENAHILARLMFVSEVSVDNPEIRQVVVIYDKSAPGRESVVPVSEGKALVPLYDGEYKLLLEDGRRNRYCVSVPYTMEKLMIPGKLVKLAEPFVDDRIGFDLFLCQGGRGNINVTQENAARFRTISESPLIREDYKREVRVRLVQFYYENDRIREMDAYLEELEPGRMNTAERNEIIRHMVLRGMYDKAFDWVCRFGTYGLEAKTAVRLCSRMLAREERGADRKMTEIAHYAFRKGKYDETLLDYMVHHFDGTSKELRDIWRAADNFGIESDRLCERLLIQMLYTGSFVGERMEIFQEYVKRGANPEVEEAFLAQCSYDYFVKDKLMDAFVPEDIVKLWHQGEPVQKVCRLAVLKYYADNRECADERTKAAIQAFLQDMLDKRICFPFFKEYGEELPMMEQFQDKTMIEYKTRPGVRAVIHYILEKDEGTDSEYKREVLQDMYEGVCVKEFILFFGETLQYYITEEEDGEEQLTESGTISKSDIGRDAGDGRFNMINDIVTGRTLQDYETAHRLLEEYSRKDFLSGRLFPLREG